MFSIMFGTIQNHQIDIKYSVGKYFLIFRCNATRCISSYAIVVCLCVCLSVCVCMPRLWTPGKRFEIEMSCDGTVLKPNRKPRFSYKTIPYRNRRFLGDKLRFLPIFLFRVYFPQFMNMNCEREKYAHKEEWKQ